jgi:hypothetical protein
MRKLLLLVSMLFIISGCVGQAKENNDTSRLAPPYLVIDNFFIYDETIQGDVMCAQVIEEIHEVDGVVYALPCLKSGNISFVRTTDYKSFNIKEIIEQNLISLDVLVENKIIFVFNKDE